MALLLSESHKRQIYIGGQWVTPTSDRLIDVIDPSSEKSIAKVALGSPQDVDNAVRAARTAFISYAHSTRQERTQILKRLASAYSERAEELAVVLSLEMGAPLTLARSAQVGSGLTHLLKMIEVLDDFPFEERRGRTSIVKEAIGVCGLITPWNWPLNQIMCKVAPALAAGCTMVLKPSEAAPLSGIVFAELMDAARAPSGVFNLVNGEGAVVGEALSRHSEIDMVSFTGSTLAGVSVARSAANSIKRVHQELGGKSANIILPTADLAVAVTRGVEACFRNAGQSCNSPGRMLIPKGFYNEAVAIAKAAAECIRVGPPASQETTVGPLANARQFERVQNYIQIGIEEGAELLSGGLGKPPGFTVGYYAKPTIFGRVRPDMRIAREEIFGPVLCLITYDGEEEAIEIANDTDYGLAAYIQSTDLEQAERVAARIRAGTIYVNNPPFDPGAPFGGYKKSGNGREYADFGLDSFLEIKGIVRPE
jgi:aldehyde dehydrogenase (NAD+)